MHSSTVARRIRQGLGALVSCAAIASSARAHEPSSAPIEGNAGTYDVSPHANDSVDSLTGTATASYSFELPPGRAGVQPALTLRYSHTQGPDIAGESWALDLPTIERRGLGGGPPTYSPADHYELSGSALVEVCAAAPCSGDIAPSWAAGWTMFRPRAEGHSTPVFASPKQGDEHRTFRVLHADGSFLELGVARADQGDYRGLDRDRYSGLIYRWNIVRMFDATPSTKNVVEYVWKHVLYGENSDRGRLEDIYYTGPVDGSLMATNAAHHVHLDYEVWRPRHQVFPPMALRRHDSILVRVAVASRGENHSLPRERVRVYELKYHTEHMITRGRPFLAQIAPYGRCLPIVREQAIGTDRDVYQLPTDSIGCAELPLTTFEYSDEARFLDGGGFHGNLVPKEIRIPADCGASGEPALSAAHVALADVNRDGLPDIIQTARPYNPIYINSAAGGYPTTFGCSHLNSVWNPGYEDFGSTGSLTAPGYWTEGFAYAYAVRSGPPVSYTDGFPKDVKRIRPDGAGYVSEFGGAASGPVLPAPHVLGDLNGDGLSDAIYVTTTSQGSPVASDPMKVAFSSRQSNATVARFASSASTNLYIGIKGKSLWAPSYAALADMNGDGILDYVTTDDPTATEGHFVYLPGRGNGEFGCQDHVTASADCELATRSTGYDQVTGVALKEVRLSLASGSTLPLPTIYQAGDPRIEDRGTLFHDVNGDGRADLIKFHGAETRYSLQIFLNIDGKYFRNVPLIEMATGVDSGGYYPSMSRILFADMNGNGVDDIVLLGDIVGATNPLVLYYDLEGLDVGAPRPGLLRRILHGGGATTEYRYASLRDEEAESFMPGYPWPQDSSEPETGPWAYHSPVPRAVVKSVTVSANAPAPYDYRSETIYEYRDPVFDTWRGAFRGFRRVRATTDLESVDVKFHFGECLAEDGWTTDSRADECVNPETDVSNALQGMPVQVEHLDSAGRYRSTTRFTYDVTSSGLQAFVYASEANTFLYDTGPFMPSPTPITATEARVDGRTTYVKPTVLRAAATRVRTRQLFNAHRNLTDVWDDGRVSAMPFDAPTAIDRPIHERRLDYLPISGIGIYRPYRHQTVYDSGGQTQPLLDGGWHDGPTRELSFTYDSSARLTSVSATLSGALPLARSHRTLQPIAAEPLSAAANGTTIDLHTISYDAYGNPAQVVRPNNQCRRWSYKSPYHDVVETDVRSAYNIYDGCDNGSYVTSLVFDRGIDKVLSVTEPSLATTKFGYDLRGRLISVEGPDPSTPLATMPDVELQYSNDLVGAVHWVKSTRLSADTNNYTVWSFGDSLGHSIATLEQADPSAGDEAAWIAHPSPELDPHGRPVRSFKPWFYAGDPTTFVGGTGGGVEATMLYDLGRLGWVSRASDGATSRRVFHALSVDVWDPENLAVAGPHYGAFSTTLRDGHGRVVQRTKAGNAPSDIRYEYLPTGELKALERRFMDPEGGLRRYRRWARFDSLGRMVENAEPNATEGFSADPSSTSTMKAWRYAYDKSGRLVGTRDPRGCGKNIVYDNFDRPSYEDYSPCEPDHEPYTTPSVFYGSGMEVKYTYDGVLSTYQSYSTAARGRLVGIVDRAGYTRVGYDGRGREIARHRSIRKPGAVHGWGYGYLAAHEYLSLTSFDGLGRVKKRSTGADAPELLEGGSSETEFHYSARGLLTRIDGSYGALISDRRAAADGFVTSTVYGDAAATRAEMTADVNRMLRSYRLWRSPGPWVSAGGYTPPSPGVMTMQSELANEEFTYDQVGNITSLVDLRDEAMWPSGAKPTTKILGHDAQYRVTTIQANHGHDSFVSPFAAEVSAADGRPIPHQSFSTRYLSQQFGYDGFGNMVGAPTAPDSTVFDRGLSDVLIGYDAASEALNKPNRLIAAGASATDDLATHYDEAGNLVALDLQRPTTRCLQASQKCSQRFLFTWDEVNQLSRARRWDYTSLQPPVPIYPSPPSGPPEVDLRYVYSSGVRIVKHEADPAGDASNDRFTIDVFPSLRLHRTTYDEAQEDYDGSAERQHVYLNGVAKVVYAENLPTTGSHRHVYLQFGDHLGSASIVVDKGTSELVEYRGYQPYGATDYDYRPERWQSFREDMHFTGKEEDVEVGLTYFGARYYSPYLQRFISPDPLTIHGWGADPNPYAYVRGRVFNEVDPFGLDSTGCIGREDCSGRSAWDGGGSGGQIGIDVGGFVSGFGNTLARLFGGGGGGASGGGASASRPPPPPAAPGYAVGAAAAGGIVEWNKGGWNGLVQATVPTILWPYGMIPALAEVITAPLKFDCQSATCIGSEFASAAVIAATGPKAFGGASASSVAAAEGGAMVAGSGAAEVESATVLREIAHGEKIKDIVSQVSSLREATGLEYAVVSRTNGTRALVYGGRGGIDFTNFPLRRILGHSHPLGYPTPSAADFHLLESLGQRSSWLLEEGLIRFGVRPVP